jgi:hypothetical protein
LSLIIAPLQLSCLHMIQRITTVLPDTLTHGCPSQDCFYHHLPSSTVLLFLLWHPVRCSARMSSESQVLLLSHRLWACPPQQLWFLEITASDFLKS